MIATIPKSGTWSQKYFWSVLDALAVGYDHFDPQTHFYQPHSLDCEVFGIMHFFCLGWQNAVHPGMKAKIEAARYPSIKNVDQSQNNPLLNQLGASLTPSLNPDCKIALVCRHPLDQIASYFRPAWCQATQQAMGVSDTSDLRFELQSEDKAPIYFDTLKAALRHGAMDSYCIQLRTFLDVRAHTENRVALYRYEDFVSDRAATFNALSSFLNLNINPDIFDKALMLTDKSTLKALEENTGRSIMYDEKAHKDRPDWAFKMHIKSDHSADRQDIFDPDDIAFACERLDWFDIPLTLFGPGNSL